MAGPAHGPARPHRQRARPARARRGARAARPARLNRTPSPGTHDHHDPTDQRRPVMEVILLERVGRLGHMGDVVRVKDGFARNFLLPKGKALRATKENKAKYEGMKVELEARNTEMRGEAQKVG